MMKQFFTKIRRIRKRKPLFFSLLLVGIFSAGAFGVWGATIYSLTLRRPSIDGGLLAHYTFDGPEVDGGLFSFTPSDGVGWTQETASADWPARTRLGGTLLYNNLFWVMGGWDGSNSLGDVWYSADGVDWTLATNSPAWGTKATHETLVYDDRMWVIGGGNKAVHYSTDGVTWTQATASAAWTGGYRNQHQVVAYDGRMWMMGGTTGTDMNDVWWSTDGANWTQATSSAGWSPRQNHRVVVFDGRMWVIGGGSMKDVWWSTDGANWTQATSDGGWGGSARYRFGLVAYDNKMWILAGNSGSSATSDVWHSADGVTWTQATSSVPWGPREEHGFLVHNNRMWVLGGMSASGNSNDVWSSEVGATSSPNEIEDSSGNGYHGSYVATVAPLSLVRTVTASGNDAQQLGSTVTINGSILSIGGTSTDTSNRTTVGLRFLNVNVPPDATVTDARIHFTSSGADSSSVSPVIRAEDSDDAAIFTTGANNITSRTLTSASETWSSVPTWSNDEHAANQLTPNLSSLVQEVVDRPGWDAGNAMAFTITAPSGRRQADGLDGSPAGAAELQVSYTLNDASSEKFVPGKIGQGVGFSGEGEYINVGAGPTGVRTIAFWMRARNLDAPVIRLSDSASVDLEEGTPPTPYSSIEYMGHATGTTSATLPELHQAGDLILAWAYRDGSNVIPPTVPAGWAVAGTMNGNTQTAVLAWRIAPSGSTPSGTWTSATNVIFQVYRGADVNRPIGAVNFATGSSTTVSYPALTLRQTNGTSWVAGFSGHRSTNTSLETPPTGMTNFGNHVNGTLSEAAGHNTAGSVASWSNQNVSVGGTSSGWLGATVEILSEFTSGPAEGDISYVGGASGVTSVTMPSHQADDLLLMWAYRDGSTTPPTVPAGWTRVDFLGASTNSGVVGYKIAANGSETSGTWTSATSVIAGVYRNVDTYTPIGSVARNSGTSTTIPYGAVTLTAGTSGRSWLVGFAGHRSTNTNLQTPPTGMVNRVNVVDGTDEASLHDTNGVRTSNWSSTNVSAGGTSSGYRTNVVEIMGVAPLIPPLPAESGSVATTGITSPTIYVDGAPGSGVDLNEWHHVVITTTSDISANDLMIGRNGGGYFTGEIDDVRIYDDVLSAAEIERIYRLGATTKIGVSLSRSSIDSGLVAHHTFDGPQVASETSFTDKSGNGRTLTFGSPTTVGIGRIGQGIRFSGTSGEFATVAHHTSLTPGSGSFAYGLWVYPEVNVSDWDMPIYKGGASGGDAGYDMELGDDVWGAGVSDGSSVVNVFFNPGGWCCGTYLSPGQWYHLMVVVDRSSNELRAYVNGIETDTTASIAGLGSIGGTKDLNLGHRSGGGPDDVFRGRMDDVRIYNRALSDEEVYRIYDMGATTHVGVAFTPAELEEGLAAYYPLDGFSGTDGTANDETGNGYDGVYNLSGGPQSFIRTISANTDDALQAGSTVTTGGTQLSLGGTQTGTGARRTVGLRFTNITIPEGATVTDARIHFMSMGWDSSSFNPVVAVEASDNASTFSASSNNITSRSWSSTLPWSSVPTWSNNQHNDNQLTPNLASLVQTVVDRPGWSSGNAIAFRITAPSGRRRADARESSAANAAELQIEYTLAGGPSSKVVPGRIGQALSFDGTSDYVDIGFGPTAVRSLAFWVRPASDSEPLLQLNGSSNIQLSSGSVTTTGIPSPTVYVNGQAGSSGVELGKWNYIVITTSSAINASNFTLGVVNDTDFFAGDMDAVRVYSRVLASDEVERLYSLAQ